MPFNLSFIYRSISLSISYILTMLRHYLGNPGDHVMYVIPVSRTVYYNHVVDGGVHPSTFAVYGMISFSFHFQFVHYPRKFERWFSSLLKMQHNFNSKCLYKLLC